MCGAGAVITCEVDDKRLELKMAQKDSFIQKVFYEISLEKDPGLWQNEEDTTEKNIERIRLISGFPQTRYKAQLEKNNSSPKFYFEIGCYFWVDSCCAGIEVLMPRLRCTC